MKILSKQNFNQNESKNFVVDNLSSAPSNPILGQVYYNTQNERAYVCIKSGETPEWADLSLQEEVSIGREEPNGRDIKIWINPEDMASSSDYGSLPIGSIISYSGETAPEGYSICDGKELNRETYKELFSIIGTTFGNGDGTSTFNLPDLKGRISVGLDSSDTDFDTLGKTGGKKTHTLTIDEIPAHTHNLTYNASGAGANTGDTVALGNTSTTSPFATLPTGGSKEHNNLQPYIVLNYIIKIYGEAMLTGDVIDSLEGDSSYNAPSIHAVNTKIKELEAYSSTAINEGSEITLAPNPNPNYNPIDIQIDGKSEQTTTKGNQLLDFSKYDSSSSATMTLTFENDVLTTTCIASGPYMSFTWIITDLIKANPGKTLSFTFDKYDASQATDSSVNLQIYTGSNVSYFGLVRSDGTSVPYTIPEDVSNISTVNFRILPNNLKTPKASTLVITKPMLQFGTDKLEYESYTGRQPSPNPDYPSEIKTVKGVRNYFTLGNNTLSGIGVTVDYKNSELTLNGTTTNSGNIFQKNDDISYDGYRKIGTFKKGTYTLSSKLISGSFTIPDGCSFAIYLRDDKQTRITYITNSFAFNNTFTLTEETNLYFQIHCNSGGIIFEDVTVDFQIEEGSIAHKIVPYGSWLEVKNTGKNKLEFVDGTYSHNGITADIENGKITLNGTATATSFIAINNAFNYTFKANQKYTISFNNKTLTRGTDARFRFSKNRGIVVKDFYFNNINSSQTFYFTEDTEVKWIQIRTGVNITYDNFIIFPQLEKGSTATEYEPYKETSTLIDMNKYDSDGNITGYYELSSIGDTKDILTIQNGQATINQKIGKVVLDGSEVWIANRTTTPYVYGSSIITDYLKTNENICKSNYFESTINGGYGVMTDNQIKFRYASDGNYALYICTTIASTLANFKTWLSENPVTVYYILAEPETITLNGSYDIELFEGTNNITTTDELQPNMKIEYYTDVMGNPGVIPDYDGLPVGSEIDFDGTSTDIPTGWEETTDPESYSTDEVKTNKTWIDGKPIYRKVVDLGFLGTQTQISYGNQIDIMTSFGGYLYQDNGGNISLIEYTSSLWRAITYTITSHHTMNVLINRSDTFAWSDWKLKIVIEYTKTTD